MTLRAIQRGLVTTSHRIEIALIFMCSVLLALLASDLFLQVLTRYVLKFSIPWTEEAARFGLVWFGLLAAAVAARRGMHFSFRWGVKPLPPKIRLRLREFVDVLVILFLVTVLKQGIAYVSIVSNQVASASEVPMWVPYSGIPAGIGFLLLFYVLEVADAILSRWTGERLSAKELQEAEIYRQLEHPEQPMLAMPIVGTDATLVPMESAAARDCP
jgi:TRAP-type C4-dicarboxylate transport system permease small subunit